MSSAGRHTVSAPARPAARRWPPEKLANWARRAKRARAGVRVPPPTRLGVTGTVAAGVAVAAIAAAVIVDRPPAAGPARPKGPSAAATAPARAAPSLAGPGTGAARPPAAARPAAVPLVLTADDYRSCPAGATACVDLNRHITWLQASGEITFGPVQMEPGRPGSAHQTPRGAFHVAWKAGPDYVSNIYHEAMPWATFFAAGGIAFHAGSLTRWSHGCVHLTTANAYYYQQHLPIGAEVVVF